jgi:hypothetical protein
VVARSPPRDGFAFTIPCFADPADPQVATDLTALRAHATDPRLAQAAAHASDGQVTQYLAGAPLLKERYENTTPPITKALLDAAMDARRLGCGPDLPLPLLAAAAPGYLTDTDWNQTPEDWLRAALDYTTEPCNAPPASSQPPKPTAHATSARAPPHTSPHQAGHQRRDRSTASPTTSINTAANNAPNRSHPSTFGPPWPPTPTPAT